jgi:3-oxoacyl-[acyl-carrier-protein] synthase II
MYNDKAEVCVTGIGLVSSLGEGVDAHADVLSGRRPAEPSVDEATFFPYPVHPLPPLQLGRQIPKNSDQRQMEGWQKIGVYAAGLALDDAGLKDEPALLDSTDLIVAAGSGERDTGVDCKILDADAANGGARLLAAQILPGALRPTLFLAQLSNLLAGNISIVHHVTGSSRTFMGEEMAGLSAVENAWARVASGQSQRCLVGGALNAQREDLLLAYELGHNLWRRPWRPIAQRGLDNGGFIPGSVGAFLILESAQSAAARGAASYCTIASVKTARGARTNGGVAQSLTELLGVLTSRGINPAGFESESDGPESRATAIFSGASGLASLAAEEFEFISQGARPRGIRGPVWTYGDLTGHGVEAHFPLGVALAALALKSRAELPFLSGPEPATHGIAGRILVTSVGHWRGEGLTLLQPIS